MNSETYPAADHETSNSQPTTAPVSPKPPTAIQRWIRLDDMRTFGSITGSEFRVWGDDSR